MKNLTVNRSALSKESMDVIENITNDENSSFEIRNENINQIETPEEYVRESGKETDKDFKSQEIDLLWQTFKSAQFNGSSPLLWCIGGFCSGIIVTLAVLVLMGTFSTQTTTPNKIAVPTDTNIEKIENNQNDLTAQTENTEITNAETDNTAESSLNLENAQKYTIKDGDTVERIIIHFYGSYSPERAQMIMKANNLDNLDKISIGQVLIIPSEN